MPNDKPAPPKESTSSMLGRAAKLAFNKGREIFTMSKTRDQLKQAGGEKRPGDVPGLRGHDRPKVAPKRSTGKRR
jgi:hypothetical protein